MVPERWRTRRGLITTVAAVVLVGVLLRYGGVVADAVKALLERILELPGPVLAVTVGALALLETAAFAGLAVPGELAVIVGGVAAYEERAPLAVMIGAAVAGAIAGDSLGFLFGRRFGTRLLDGRIGELMGRERVISTMQRIRRGGIKAVILGRFVGVLRAVMPFAAGASQMSYGRFLVASVAGATAWGVGFTILGYLAGSSWRRAEEYAGQASKVLAAVVVFIVFTVWAAHRLAERQDAARAAWRRFRARPRVAAVLQRYDRELGFLVRRFRRGPAAGLQLTISLVALAALGYVLAIVYDQALGSGAIVDLNEPVRRELAEAQTAGLTELMRAVRDAVGPSSLGGLAALVGIVAWIVDRRPRAAILLAGAGSGAALLATILRRVIDESDPLVTHSSFPSQRITVVTALLYGLVAVVVPRIPRWTWAVAVVAVATVMLFASSLAVLYLRQLRLTDVAGGVVLGVLWGVAVSTAVATAWPARRHSRRGQESVTAHEDAKVS